MNVNKTEEKGKIILAPDGWLDTLSSPTLVEAVDALTEARELVLDFEKVEYLSSAGLRAVVAASKKAKDLGAAFAVVNVGPEVLSIFKMTGIDRKLNISGK